MLRKILPIGVIIVLFPLGVWAQARQSKDAFQWKGKAPGLFLRNLNGPVQVEAASGADIEIVGTVSWKDSNPADIRFEVKPGGKGVTICALWPAKKAECGENGDYSIADGTKNDLAVAFKVKLPKGTSLDVSTVNGAVEIQGATAPVAARSVNGAVNVKTSNSSVTVETVNGAIQTEITGAAAGDLNFKTVNGAIEVKLPSGFDADVEADTVNGGVVIGGQHFRHSARAKLGKGGRKLEAQTVNGSISVN